MLDLQLLGGRRLLRDGRNIGSEIRYRKGWAVLGYLAVERGCPHSRAQLAEWLWPGLDPAAARTNLRQVLTDLNQMFDRHGGSGLLEITRDSVALFPQPQLRIDLLALDAARLLPAEASEQDVAAVERHVDALGGCFMADFGLADCPRFEEWLESARRNLLAEMVASMGRLCLAQQLLGRVPQAIASARKLVEVDGWNEDFQRQLMRLLAQGGLHQQALAQYQALAGSLMEELGVMPEPRTQALYAQLRAELRKPAAAQGGDAVVKARLGLAAGDGRAAAAELMTQRTLPLRPLRGEGAGDGGWLLVERGPNRGSRIEVTTMPVTIGRTRDSDLCIPHDTVSRQHCIVWLEEDGYRVRDLGSTNGTRVNDAQVQEAALDDGDAIVIGEMVLRFRRGSEALDA